MLLYWYLGSHSNLYHDFNVGECVKNKQVLVNKSVPTVTSGAMKTGKCTLLVSTVASVVT